MTDPALDAFNRLFGPEFGHGKPLDRVRLISALNALGAPHEKLAPVIHVAGTNGKGSAIAFMRAIAQAAGLRAHAFTKPHLFALRERFIVAGAEADDKALIEAAGRIARVDGGLTQFDAQAAAAILLFSEAPGDLVLLETGMGGREDSTNVIASPALSLIAPVALDHQDVLGATIGEIAAHKAGVLKPGAPAIIARQAPEAGAVIEAEAARVGAPLLREGAEWDAYVSAGRLIVQTHTRTLDLPPPALFGAHQAQNAGLAAMAMLTLRPRLGEDALAHGIAHARWPGRLQPLTRGALSAPIRAIGGEVWIDGGHNAHAAQALARALGDMAARRGGAAVVILGLRQSKDAAAFIGAIRAGASHIIAVPLSAAHVAPAQLVSLAQQAGLSARAAGSLAAAMQSAAQFPAPRVLICGSFLIAAEALATEGA